MNIDQNTGPMARQALLVFAKAERCVARQWCDVGESFASAAAADGTGWCESDATLALHPLDVSDSKNIPKKREISAKRFRVLASYSRPLALFEAFSEGPSSDSLIFLELFDWILLLCLLHRAHNCLPTQHYVPSGISRTWELCNETLCSCNKSFHVSAQWRIPSQATATMFVQARTRKRGDGA
jgi:hypothetical protein